jgi:hypothetical protein
MDQRKKFAPEKEEDQHDKEKRKKFSMKEGRSAQGTLGSRTNHAQGVRKWTSGVHLEF